MVCKHVHVLSLEFGFKINVGCHVANNKYYVGWNKPSRTKWVSFGAMRAIQIQIYLYILIYIFMYIYIFIYLFMYTFKYTYVCYDDTGICV